jgi:glycerol kinase
LRYGVIDIGGTGVKVSVYDEGFRKTDHVKIKIPMRSTPEGLVDHDASMIRDAVLHGFRWLRERGVRLAGIATYRASILAWGRDGKPLTNVITWMDRSSRAIASKPIYRILGLAPILGKVFRADSPAMRIKWLLETNPALRVGVERGDIYIGTLSSYIAYIASSRYMNDASNEALTGLLNPKNFKRLWFVYDLLGIPRSIDPEVVDNVGYIGSIEGIDIAVLIADQQASIIGSSCLSSSCLKITGSTGVFVDAVVEKYILPGKALIPLVVYRIKGDALYAIEGFAPSGGSIIEWLVRTGILESVEELDRIASEARGSVIFIPSLTHLSHPLEREEATGLLYGLSHSTSRSDIVRGVLEGIVLTIASLAETVERVAGRRDLVRVDGGLSNSTVYLELLASACKRRVERVRGVDGAGRGVALLLAVYEGRIKKEELGKLGDVDLSVEPGVLDLKVNTNMWRRALEWGSRTS